MFCCRDCRCGCCRVSAAGPADWVAGRGTPLARGRNTPCCRAVLLRLGVVCRQHRRITEVAVLGSINIHAYISYKFPN